MDELIDLIFSNPLFLILIIGGIISLFRGSSDQKNEQNQRTNRPKPVPNQHTRTQPHRQRSETRRVEPKQEAVHSISIEDQREKQLEQLTSRLGSQAADSEHSGLKNRPKIADQKRTAEIQSLHNQKVKAEFKRKFKKNLSRSGLIDSVIMSEVLGAPRARKPYRSVVSKRNQ